MEMTHAQVWSSGASWLAYPTSINISSVQGVEEF